MATQNCVNLKTISWKKESYGLFDYTNQNTEEKYYKVHKSSHTLKPKSSIDLQVSEITQLNRETLISHKDYLFTIMSCERQEKFHLMTPYVEGYDRNRNNLFLVVRSLRNDNGDYLGYNMGLGDIFKLGRIEFKVVEYKPVEGQVVSGYYAPTEAAANAYGIIIQKCQFALRNKSKCKICKENDQEGENYLVNLCNCEKSEGPVHIKCIQNWINKKEKCIKTSGSECRYYEKLFCEDCKKPLPDLVEVNGRRIPLFKPEKPTSAYIVLERIFYDRSKDGSKEKYEDSLKTLIMVTLIDPKAEMKLGRELDCDIRENDVSISRKHAIIKYTGQNFTIYDNDSKFGTLVLLRSGFEILHRKIGIQVGRTLMTFYLDRAPIVRAIQSNVPQNQLYVFRNRFVNVPENLSSRQQAEVLEQNPLWNGENDTLSHIFNRAQYLSMQDDHDEYYSESSYQGLNSTVDVSAVYNPDVLNTLQAGNTLSRVQAHIQTTASDQDNSQGNILDSNTRNSNNSFLNSSNQRGDSSFASVHSREVEQIDPALQDNSSNPQTHFLYGQVMNNEENGGNNYRGNNSNLHPSAPNSSYNHSSNVGISQPRSNTGIVQPMANVLNSRTEQNHSPPRYTATNPSSSSNDDRRDGGKYGLNTHAESISDKPVENNANIEFSARNVSSNSNTGNNDSENPSRVQSRMDSNTGNREHQYLIPNVIPDSVSHSNPLNNNRPAIMGINSFASTNTDKARPLSNVNMHSSSGHDNSNLEQKNTNSSANPSSHGFNSNINSSNLGQGQPVNAVSDSYNQGNQITVSDMKGFNNFNPSNTGTNPPLTNANMNSSSGHDHSKRALLNSNSSADSRNGNYEEFKTNEVNSHSGDISDKRAEINANPESYSEKIPLFSNNSNNSVQENPSSHGINSNTNNSNVGLAQPVNVVSDLVDRRNLVPISEIGSMNNFISSNSGTNPLINTYMNSSTERDNSHLAPLNASLSANSRVHDPEEYKNNGLNSNTGNISDTVIRNTSQQESHLGVGQLQPHNTNTNMQENHSSNVVNSNTSHSNLGHAQPINVISDSSVQGNPVSFSEIGSINNFISSNTGTNRPLNNANLHSSADNNHSQSVEVNRNSSANSKMDSGEVESNNAHLNSNAGNISNTIIRNRSQNESSAESVNNIGHEAILSHNAQYSSNNVISQNTNNNNNLGNSQPVKAFSNNHREEAKEANLNSYSESLSNQNVAHNANLKSNSGVIQSNSQVYHNISSEKKHSDINNPNHSYNLNDMNDFNAGLGLDEVSDYYGNREQQPTNSNTEQNPVDSNNSQGGTISIGENTSVNDNTQSRGLGENSNKPTPEEISETDKASIVRNTVS